MKVLLVLALTIVMASSAFAVIDPDDNMIGLYFDATADTPIENGIAGFGTVPVYAVLTNPTFDSLFGFEFQVVIDGPGLVISDVIANPENVNVGTGVNYIVGFGAPTATTEATVLVTMTVLYQDATAVPGVFFSLSPSEPSSIDEGLPVMLLADGALTTVGYSAQYMNDGMRSVQAVAGFGGAGGEEVSLGSMGIVDTEAKSFDSVKSLYR